MERHFSLAKIENKLQSLMRFSGSSGVVFASGEQVYACPEGLYENIGSLSESLGGEINLIDLSEHLTNIKTIPLHKGNLILIDPSAPLEECTLEFLGEQLQGEIELFSIFDSILEANMAISSNLNLKTLLNIVMSLSEEILNTEVSAVMLLSPDKKELYWEISRGEGSEFFQEKIRLPVGEGIGGYVAQTGEGVFTNDVSGDPRWCSSYDEKSGFRTRSMICVPVKYHGEILGVIEVINKKTGEFTPRDLRILEVLAAQTGGAIENARIHGKLEEAYEELKTLDKAKERVINHLSHELKTPLALISSALEIISRNIKKSNITKLEKPIRRGKRNLSRLLELQAKIDDIVNQRSVEEGESIIRIIEDAASFVEELSEESHGKNTEALELVSKRIRSLFKLEEIRMEKILLDEFLDNLCDETILSAPSRELKITRNLENEIVLNMDRNVLRKVCGGLLKNAIENTPDGGEIVINTKSADTVIRIDFYDRGVGVTPQNQKLIFKGFFHTQDTNLYSSRRPYEFNAGGSGSDLLRTKILSERYGFSVDFDSRRCKFIPEDSDTCPGKISSCHFIKKKSECFSSGSSTFSIKFPIP
jgi:signal transduction histidine kinase